MKTMFLHLICQIEITIATNLEPSHETTYTHYVDVHFYQIKDYEFYEYL